MESNKSCETTKQMKNKTRIDAEKEMFSRKGERLRYSREANVSVEFEEGDEKRSQQIQKQDQLQRSAEASKQMLFAVFGNVLSILEEHEKRTSVRRLPKSDIELPDQSWKTDEDVKTNVETQLLLFQTQSKACPKEVREEVNLELRKKTLEWAAVRAEEGVPLEEADEFICQLYEILATGKAEHSILEHKTSEVSAETIKDTLPKLFKGKYQATILDEAFKHDQKRKAESPKIRTIDDGEAFKIGAERMVKQRHSLKRFLLGDLEEFVKEGPSNLR
ncbi:uncharacterized protein LOC128208816 [Mya arenaria]|uniref:uncharacterized protein LOC128208816 n=1 Tax=Mya arenaria TaxID=6604 RepID=UPI0022E7EC1B|nr:uncharacterized protein LOC128208816 [Mya arenaria]XP_052768401.1 uncharacterized protein LOC128208816 [Mya arenaria]